VAKDLFIGFVPQNTTMSFEKDDLEVVTMQIFSSTATSNEINENAVNSGIQAKVVEQSEVIISPRPKEVDQKMHDMVCARAWFESLSSADRSAAVGFVDPTFLEALRLSLLSRRGANNDHSDLLTKTKGMLIVWVHFVQ
jgi:hypothetical protein